MTQKTKLLVSARCTTLVSIIFHFKAIFKFHFLRQKRLSTNFNDVISSVTMAAACLTGRDIVDLPHVCAVSQEMTGPCALTESFH
jgi:hypothetical protein